MAHIDWTIGRLEKSVEALEEIVEKLSHKVDSLQTESSERKGMSRVAVIIWGSASGLATTLLTGLLS